ncbi:hypothetical protein [Phaeovulum sp. NW3]|uniref:hypothetical protein n=1 Tax=Phaeovulum sp. NW3 TaxID=2934933 RepID=UPI002021EDFC|nr:hypothetical protein [Phaeovulum sp. NW3]MCL7466382.1 hypothetical protein [Phaeovulum sp. NW3]
MKNWSEPFDALVEHMHLHRNAYCCAARLLGGMRAEKRTAALIGDLINVPQMTRRLARELTALHDLLARGPSGECVPEETGRFAALASEASVAAEICLLEESLGECLAALCEGGPISELERAVQATDQGRKLSGA